MKMMTTMMMLHSVYMKLLFTFAHGDHSQCVPVAIVPTVHHDRLFYTLQRI